MYPLPINVNKNMKIIKCKYCGKEFETDGSFKRAGQITAHMRTCEYNPKRNANIEARKRGSMTMHNKVAEKQKFKKEKIEKTRKFRTFICSNPTCKNEYQLELNDLEYEQVLSNKKYIRKFCCRSCANGKGIPKYIRDKTIKKIPIKGKKYIKQYKFKPSTINNDIWILDTEFYKTNRKNTHKNRYISEETRKKLSLAGRKSAAKQFMLKRSKCEIEFYQLCEKYFNHVEHNKPIFNGWDADILLLDLKIAIQWNGPWHYKQISKKKTASLAAIQNRDKIKRQEIEKAGWSLYIIKDQDSHKNTQKRLFFVKNHFDRFISFIENNKNKQFYEEFELI